MPHTLPAGYQHDSLYRSLSRSWHPAYSEFLPLIHTVYRHAYPEFDSFTSHQYLIFKFSSDTYRGTNGWSELGSFVRVALEPVRDVHGRSIGECRFVVSYAERGGATATVEAYGWQSAATAVLAFLLRAHLSFHRTPTRQE